MEDNNNSILHKYIIREIPFVIFNDGVYSIKKGTSSKNFIKLNNHIGDTGWLETNVTYKDNCFVMHRGHHELNHMIQGMSVKMSACSMKDAVNAIDPDKQDINMLSFRAEDLPVYSEFKTRTKDELSLDTGIKPNVLLYVLEIREYWISKEDNTRSYTYNLYVEDMLIREVIQDDDVVLQTCYVGEPYLIFNGHGEMDYISKAIEIKIKSN